MCCARGADDIVMGSPPLAFTFGLGGLLIFRCGRARRCSSRTFAYTPQAMAQLMYESGATICYTAPTFYRQMAPFVKALHAERGGPPPLRICVSAGEALPDATRQLWKEASGIEMLDGIGATEMFHIFVSAAPQDVRRGAIGKVVPGYVAKVVDDNGARSAGGHGRQARGAGADRLPLHGRRAPGQLCRAGWNHPGDAFVQDADGYFFYQARTDDMIITSGYNVGAPEVEDALLRHPAVAECGVIGKPDDERGMIVKAFCVLRSGHVGDANLVRALQDHVKASIAPYKYPREIEFVPALPRTETGKLQRFRLKQP
jgi:2-aminobenzoate-CoA ligase